MSRLIEFHYDFLSPYSYLAFTRLPALAERWQAEIVYRPIEVLKVMAAVGNAPTTVLCPAKGRYATADLARWAQSYGVAFNRNPHHRRIDGGALLQGAVLATRDGRAAQYAGAIFKAMWVDQAAFADDAEIARILAEAGFPDGESLVANRREAQPELDALNAAAAAAGIFGVPSFTLNGELFFGNDRLDFLEAALRQPKEVA
jgi:2-hydroxychromene-2-carboxylate isomerase